MGLTIALSLKIGSVPPIGKFTDPFHGIWSNAENVMETYENNNYNIPGLKEKVEIYYDENLVPHVFAENDHDLYLAQGYVTAMHRLWQMEFQTYAAAGRVSEIIGEKALEFDRLQRRKGMVFGANNALKALTENDTVWEAVQAYAAGVNAYINSLDYENLPVEYKLLDYAPEPWTPLKTALLLKYMADDLSGWDADVENTNAYFLLGEERFNFFFPDTLMNTDPIIPNDTEYGFEALTIDSSNFFIPEVSIPNSLPAANPDNGSNNWVVAGSKTNSGNPILANDPHLGLNLPSIWYVMQLKAPGINAMGATLPGALGVIIGFNEDISWGATNARRDVRDWYALEFKDKDKNDYLFDDKWLKTQKIAEEIKIRGEGSFFDTVVYTHYGPVVYDSAFAGTGDKQNYSLRWIAHDPSEEQYTFHLINRAKNYSDFKEALRYYSSPAQNFAFASSSGDIALWVQGKFPLKWAKQGKFIMDGSRLDQEWRGYIPFEHNAHILNPESGFVSSANQYPVGKNYPYYVYDGNYEDYRNRRINNRLASMSNITPQDMMALQNDNFNLKASESLPMMLDSLDINSLNEAEKAVYAALKNWDFFYEIDSEAASVYELWWQNLYYAIWDEFRNDSINLNTPDDFFTVNFIKNHPDDEFIDIQRTPQKETLNQLIEQTYKQAVDSAERWAEVNEKEYKWADFKGTRLQHLLRLDPFSIKNIAIGGNRGIINATSKTHGASWRMVVSVGDEPQAWGIYPGGQSGNPASPYYDNFVEMWRKGEYLPLVYMQSASDSSEINFTHTLVP